MDVEALKSELAELPLGSIVRRTYDGVVRYSHQWRRNGQTHSYSIRPEDVEDLQLKIDRRKEIERMLKLNAASAAIGSDYFTEVTTGKELRRWADQSKGWRHREILNSLLKFLRGKDEPRVFILYGLRRTGKTTLLQQAASALSANEFGKTAYVQVKPGDTMADLNKDLSALRRAGYRFVFVDEVTMMDDFIDGAAVLADIHSTTGLKIVLSGTDSLGFWLSLGDSLYDRAYVAHTTFIPFREYSSLLNVDDIDTFIRHGGMLRPGSPLVDENGRMTEDTSFHSDLAARRYVDTAIARNIQHALSAYSDGLRFRQLTALRESGELTNAINRVVEDLNHRFLVSVLERDFKSHDLGIAERNLRQDRDASRRVELRDLMSIEGVTAALMRILDIRNAAVDKSLLTQATVREIEDYLTRLDLVVRLPSRLARDGRVEELDPLVLIAQPGLRYCQADALAVALLADPTFGGLDASSKASVLARIREEVAGRMLEEVVLLETDRARRSGKTEVFKLQFDVGEFDMVVRDVQAATCELYEVKHSAVRDTGQFRHLSDKQKLADVKRLFGKVVSRTVLYRGEDAKVSGGIAYRNVDTYLKSL